MGQEIPRLIDIIHTDLIYCFVTCVLCQTIYIFYFCLFYKIFCPSVFCTWCTLNNNNNIRYDTVKAHCCVADRELLSVRQNTR